MLSSSLRVLFSSGLGIGMIVSEGAKYIVTTLISIIIMAAIKIRRLSTIRSLLYVEEGF